MFNLLLTLLFLFTCNIMHKHKLLILCGIYKEFDFYNNFLINIIIKKFVNIYQLEVYMLLIRNNLSKVFKRDLESI